MQSLGEITAGIGERAGLTLLIGEPGIGKTVLLHRLEAALAADGIPACHFSRPIASLTELAVACGGAAGPGAALPDDDALARLLIDTLASRLGPGGTAAVLADEAHAIPPECLARLCRLAELSNEAGGVLQILLSGHPSLAETLDEMLDTGMPGPEIRCVRLAPLAPAEVAAYIRYRLGFVRYIGPDLFPGPAMTRVAAHSRGNPSRINRLCSAALLNAFLEGAKTVTPAIVDRAAAEGIIGGPPRAAADGQIGVAAGSPAPGPAATDAALDSVLAAIARLQQAGTVRAEPEPHGAHRDRHEAGPSLPPQPQPHPEADRADNRADNRAPAEHAVSVRDATRQAHSDRWFRGPAGRPAPGSWRVWERPDGGAGCAMPATGGPRLPAVRHGAHLPVVADPPRLRGRPFPVPRPSRRAAAVTAALMFGAVALGTLLSMGGGSAPPEALPGPPPGPPPAPQAVAPHAVPPEPVALVVPHADAPAAAPPVVPAARPDTPPVEAQPEGFPPADPLRLLGAAAAAAAWSGPEASAADGADRDGAAAVRFDPARLYPERGFMREEDGVRLMPTEEGLRLIARTRPSPPRARPPPAQSAEVPAPPPPPQRGDCPGPRPRVPPDADMTLGEFIDSFVDDVGRLGECVF